MYIAQEHAKPGWLTFCSVLAGLLLRASVLLFVSAGGFGATTGGGFSFGTSSSAASGA